MRFKLRILKPAACELQEIYDWIQDRSPRGAEKWMDVLEKAAKRILSDPLAFPTAPEDEFSDFEVRQFFFATRQGRKYRALFTVIEDEVRILHIRGAGQDLLSDLGPIEDDENHSKEDF